MAEISKKDVEYVAGLARLAPDEAAKERLVVELGKILEYVEQLNQLDTTGIEPMMRALETTNVFREDALQESLPREEALKNAPGSDGEYFIVPRILDTE